MQELQERVGGFGESVDEALNEGVMKWLKGAAIATVAYAVVKAVIWPVVKFSMTRSEAKTFIKEAGDHLRKQVDLAVQHKPRQTHTAEAELFWVEYRFPLDWEAAVDGVIEAMSGSEDHHMPSRSAINWNQLEKSMHKAFKMMLKNDQAGDEIQLAILEAHEDRMRSETRKMFNAHVEQSMAHDAEHGDFEPEAVRGIIYRDFDEVWEHSDAWLSVDRVDRSRWDLVYNSTLSVFTLDSGMRTR